MCQSVTLKGEILKITHHFQLSIDYAILQKKNDSSHMISFRRGDPRNILYFFVAKIKSQRYEILIEITT